MGRRWVRLTQKWILSCLGRGSFSIAPPCSRAASSVPPEGPDEGVYQAGRYAGDVPALVDAVVGEDDLLGRDALGCLHSARRAVHQQPQSVVADIDQPRAEPVLPRAQHRGQRQQKLLPQLTSPLQPITGSTSAG